MIEPVEITEFSAGVQGMQQWKNEYTVASTGSATKNYFSDLEKTGAKYICAC